MARFYVYDLNNSDAVKAVRKVAAQARPGKFIPLTEAEYEAFQESVMCVEFDWPLPTQKGEAENGSGNNGEDPQKANPAKG